MTDGLPILEDLPPGVEGRMSTAFRLLSLANDIKEDILAKRQAAITNTLELVYGYTLTEY